MAAVGSALDAHGAGRVPCLAAGVPNIHFPLPGACQPLSASADHVQLARKYVPYPAVHAEKLIQPSFSLKCGMLPLDQCSNELITDDFPGVGVSIDTDVGCVCRFSSS